MRNESRNSFIKLLYCSLKPLPAEAGSVRICGTGGGGGHVTATGTGVAQLASKTSVISPQAFRFSINPLLCLFVRGFLRAGVLLGFAAGCLDLGHECGVRRLAVVQSIRLHLDCSAKSEDERADRECGVCGRGNRDHAITSFALAYSARRSGYPVRPPLMRFVMRWMSPKSASGFNFFHIHTQPADSAAYLGVSSISG